MKPECMEEESGISVFRIHRWFQHDSNFESHRTTGPQDKRVIVGGYQDLTTFKVLP